MSNNKKLICLFLKSQKTDKSSEQGYSMAMVSIITIILFSLMVAATILSNMAKARTDAFVDSNSAFYVAEAGLNRRAAELSKILKNYSKVKTVATGGPSGIGDCFQYGIAATASESTRSTTNDLACVNYRFQSSNNIARSISGGNIVSDSGGQDNNTYVAYTLVTEDKSNYDPTTNKPPYKVITGTDEFAGLNATTYTYVVSSVGKKPVALPNTDGAATTTAAKESSNNVTLGMTFVNRIVPLFQFGIFYDGDLEVNPTADMQVNGRVHSNAKMYVQPAGFAGATTKPIVTFLSKISASDGMYNGVDAWADAYDGGSTYVRTGITRVLLTGYSCATTPTTPSNCQDVLAFSSNTAKLVTADITPFNGQVKDDAPVLKTPPPSFTRKRNYSDNTIGEYFAKADMRLEMVPDRDVDSKTTTTWTRNPAKIPFNFTAINTRSAGGTCSTTKPTTGDPAADYIDPERENYSSLKCTKFTKGQLQSLRQPVMVLTEINQTRGASFKTEENSTMLKLGKPATLPSLPFTLSATDAVKLKIIRALQVAIASTPKPLNLQQLDLSFGASEYVSQPDLSTFKATFDTLLQSISSELPTADRNNLLTQASPNQIAALRGAWFLPAPIQRLERPTADTNATEAAKNPRGSGFYDGREERWITMLQTNIASLSVWNRDGLYVNATNDTMTSAYSPDPDNVIAAFNAGAGANFTDGLAFDRVTTFTNAGGAELYPPTASCDYVTISDVCTATTTYSLQYLGLGASDTTENGLVFHATVSDDLDGSGGTLVAANDVTVDTTDTTQRILKKKSDGTDATDGSGAVIVLDYYRKYPNQTTRKSPFAFAFNGGNYLPGALTLSSDQSIYIQGNFNNNATIPSKTASTPTSADGGRLPAAILADTITVLSNECLVGAVDSSNPLNVPQGQLSCGLPTKINDVSQNYSNATSAIAVNAAFLSNTEASTGNKDRGVVALASRTYSGGVNNYIRLLEDWFRGGTPLALNYSGSLISIGAPVEYSGAFRGGGRDPADATDTAYFNIPFRNVNYDTRFDDVSKLPPLTPKATYVRQSGFNRKY
jgi:Tfp pilus assembly protein PilX